MGDAPLDGPRLVRRSGNGRRQPSGSASVRWVSVGCWPAVLWLPGLDWSKVSWSSMREWTKKFWMSDSYWYESVEAKLHECRLFMASTS